MLFLPFYHHFSWLHVPLLSWRSESLPCSRGKVRKTQLECSEFCLVVWIKTRVFAAQGLGFLHQQHSEVTSPASLPLLELCNLLGKFW